MSNLYLGGDVSKGYCDFILLNEKQQIVQNHFQLDDSYKGHNVLKSLIKEKFKQYKKLTMYVGFESTGGYENNWYKLIYKLINGYNIKLIRLNPRKIYHQKAADAMKISTDKSSAISIAQHLSLYKSNLEFNVEPYYEQRRLWTFLKLIKKQKVQLMNHLEKYVYEANPILISHLKNSCPNWVLEVLLKYPTTEKLAKAKINKLSAIPYLKENVAVEIVNSAKNSVVSCGSASLEKLIVLAINELKGLRKIINETEKDLISSFNTPETKLLKSFKGIGDLNACGLVLEIGDIDNFKSSKHLASYFGIHPKFKESGDGSSKPRISKEGRSAGREILFNTIKSAIVHNAWIKTLYEEYQEKGKIKLSAMGILMHKTLRIIYGMLKNKKEYDPNIDMNNRLKFKKTRIKHNELLKIRRYQEFDENAPISRRQMKKRIEQLASPNGINPLARDR